MADSATRSFSEDQAAKTGQSSRTVRQDAERGEKIDEEVMEADENLARSEIKGAARTLSIAARAAAWERRKSFVQNLDETKKLSKRGRAEGRPVEFATETADVASSTQLGDPDAVELRAVLDGFLAAGHCLGNRLQRHALLRERLHLFELFMGPRLAVPFKSLGHGILLLGSGNGLARAGAWRELDGVAGVEG